ARAGSWAPSPSPTRARRGLTALGLAAEPPPAGRRRRGRLVGLPRARHPAPARLVIRLRARRGPLRPPLAPAVGAVAVSRPGALPSYDPFDPDRWWQDGKMALQVANEYGKLAASFLTFLAQ
ncbi:MAG TPA: hypothetical protein VGW35_14160, partial [Methylomirabilota bacterium]|nr:hypothetical protein [Methylomirabilota bacterium]